MREGKVTFSSQEDMYMSLQLHRHNGFNSLKYKDSFPHGQSLRLVFITSIVPQLLHTRQKA